MKIEKGYRMLYKKGEKGKVVYGKNLIAFYPKSNKGFFIFLDKEGFEIIETQ